MQGTRGAKKQRSKRPGATISTSTACRHRSDCHQDDVFTYTGGFTTRREMGPVLALHLATYVEAERVEIVAIS
jgi:hypothetical protein